MSKSALKGTIQGIHDVEKSLNDSEWVTPSNEWWEQ